MVTQDTLFQFIKFSSVGLLNTGIHLISVFIAIEIFGIAPAMGNSLAFLIANIFSFFLNSAWTFSHRVSLYLYARFFCVSLVGLLISWSSVWFAEKMNIHYAIGILGSIVLVAITGYTLNKLVVFTKGGGKN
jgi:putative flippase GtrA